MKSLSLSLASFHQVVSMGGSFLRVGGDLRAVLLLRGDPGCSKLPGASRRGTR